MGMHVCGSQRGGGERERESARARESESECERERERERERQCARAPHLPVEVSLFSGIVKQCKYHHILLLYPLLSLFLHVFVL
jgi:hypothetical protein